MSNKVISTTSSKAIENEGSTEEEQNIIFFTSFDLVGSTAYKIKNVESWQKDITFFYTEIKKLFTTNESPVGWQDWKFIGDEIVFKCKLKAISCEENENSDYALECALKDSYNILLEINDRISKKGMEGVKATSWIALIDEHRNYEFSFNGSGTDYIGPSIDEGFRVASKFSQKRKYTLSYDIVYLLRESNKLPRCYYLGLDNLKGVWNSRGYPIIWYSEDYEGDRQAIAYDAVLKCSYSKKFKEGALHISRELIDEIKGENNLDYLDTLEEKMIR